MVAGGLWSISKTIVRGGEKSSVYLAFNPLQKKKQQLANTEVMLSKWE